VLDGVGWTNIQISWEILRGKCWMKSVDQNTSTRESYCPDDSRLPHPCNPFEPYATQCPIVEKSRYVKKKPVPPCVPNELIPEVRPDTQMDIMLLSKDITDPCDRPGAFSIGRMVGSVKNYNDRQSAPAPNYNL